MLEGKWLQAVQGLEELGQISPEKLPFTTVKKTEIQVRNIASLCSSDEEQKQFLNAALSQLQQCPGEVTAENLLLQGYIMHKFQLSDKKAILNKWLQALKKD